MPTDATLTLGQSPRLRIRFPAGGDVSKALTVTSGPVTHAESLNSLPAKEWAIADDIMNIADSASFTVENIDGENTGKFYLGQLIQIDESDPGVAGSKWCRVFTGRVTGIRYTSDISGGSVIAVDAKDLGWHLTSCHARPLLGMEGITIDRMIRKLIDPSWGFVSTEVDSDGTKLPDLVTDNALNRRLKQGRTGEVRNWVGPLQKQFLPPIQVEPGQSPYEIIQPYLARAGWMLNVGVNGNLVLFQPAYNTDSPYDTIHYHKSIEATRSKNNVVGRPTIEESIDGIYSECQLWSTVVIPTPVQAAQISQYPNDQFRHYSYKPSINPLPFNRLFVFSDGEAINATMRKSRAIFKYQLDLFSSWSYQVDLAAHSSGGAFYCSDSLIEVDDTVHGLNATYYIESVHRSMTLQDGVRSHLTLRAPGLIDPQLQAQVGGGAAGYKPSKAVP